MARIPILHGDEITTRRQMDGIKIELGCYVMILKGPDGQPAGIKATGQGRSIDVALDRVQLKGFAEQILRALER